MFKNSDNILTENSDSVFAKKLQTLSEVSVSFFVCKRSVKNNQSKLAQHSCNIIHSVMGLQIISRQANSYFYTTPCIPIRFFYGCLGHSDIYKYRSQSVCFAYRDTLNKLRESLINDKGAPYRVREQNERRSRRFAEYLSPIGIVLRRNVNSFAIDQGP